ncbi:MAG: hypothetical protein NTW86_06440 [Candidatus Sumerlaeota bacterium]|nr:hypothetical protein [Candidatus Sumerlaeota bacterium]
MKQLVFFLALCVLLWWAYQRFGYLLYHTGSPAPARARLVAVAASPSSAGGTVLPGVDVATPPPVAGQRTPAGTISLRPVFEQACRENRLELIEYGEPAAGMVEFTVRGRDRNSVNAVLDTLQRQGVVQEVIRNAKHPKMGQPYWMKLEDGTQNHYAYWKVRTVR